MTFDVGNQGYVLKSEEGEGLSFLGAHLALKVTGAQSAGGLTVVEALAPRGHGSGLHVHERDDEIFYVLEGELRLQVDDAVHVLSKGMLGFGPRRVKHSFIVSSEQARYLVMTTPSGFEDVVRGIGEPATAVRIPDPPGPPDVAALTAITAAHGIEILGPPMSLD